MVYRERCEECDSSLVRFTFDKMETPLENGETEYVGCIMCDELLNNMLELISGRNKHVSLIRHRGRGRGRGRRGRGKGEKRSVFDDMYSCLLTKSTQINDT